MEGTSEQKSLFLRLGGFALVGELIRFGISGLAVAGSGLLSLYLFAHVFGWWYLLASSLSFAVTFVSAFTLQKFWTFRNKELQQIPRQLSWSIALATFNFFFNAGLMYVFVEVFDLHYLLAQCLTYAVIGTFDFFMYKFIVFKTSPILESMPPSYSGL